MNAPAERRMSRVDTSWLRMDNDVNQLAVGAGHETGAAVLARDDQFNLVARAVERVEHRQIRLARHAERMLHAVDFELVDEDFAAGAGFQGCAHGVMNSSAKI